METTAKALVMAVQYIADRDEDATEDDDVEMLEQIAFLLKRIGKREREALISASEELNLPEWPSQIDLLTE
jgi:hypothetical protein